MEKPETTITDLLNKLAEEMCNHYCRMLEEACKDCPLANYVESGKYRWHYLSEDPADLPPKFQEVLVFLKGGSVNRTWLEKDGLFRRLGRNSELRYKRVIAWRYIDYPEGYKNG